MKQRLDNLLAEKKLAPSREKARSLIMAGLVLVDGRAVTKAGEQVSDTADIAVKEDAIPFVSRGGLKLQKAMTVFPISLEKQICADIGASTGGFTDCMLQHGAAHVYAIDVGYGQLDWKLRNDERVTVMERTNARFMEPGWFREPVSFASIDVSFISLRLMLPPLLSCLTETGAVVALIKPQFEAGRADVGKNGVVRDPAVHCRVCSEIVSFAEQTGYIVSGLSFSPITGPKGNIEYLLWLTKAGPCGSVTKDVIQSIVDESHTSCI